LVSVTATIEPSQLLGMAAAGLSLLGSEGPSGRWGHRRRRDHRFPDVSRAGAIFSWRSVSRWGQQQVPASNVVTPHRHDPRQLPRAPLAIVVTRWNLGIDAALRWRCWFRNGWPESWRIFARRWRGAPNAGAGRKPALAPAAPDRA